MSEAKVIALVDGATGGHHLTYMRNFAKALLEMGHRVIGLTPDPEAVKTWLKDRCLDSFDMADFLRFQDREIVAPAWSFRRWYMPLMRWRAAASAIKAACAKTGCRPDIVFFCWLDDYLHDGSPLVRFVLPLVFPYRWSGLYFHPWHLRMDDADGWSIACEELLRSTNCATVALLDDGIADKLRNNIGKPVIVFPDATDESLPASGALLAEQVKTRANGRKIIGLFGSMLKRKGLLTFLDVAERCADRGWFFLCAGSFGKSERSSYALEDIKWIEQVISHCPSNMFFHAKRIDDESEFNALIRICDVVFAVYEGFAHSSGLVTKAGVFEKPVIVARGYCLDERVRKYGIGLAVEQNDSAQIVSAIERFTENPKWYAPGPAPDFDGFKRDYSLSALKKSFSELLSV